jgi:CheY-like chemotaxis protein
MDATSVKTRFADELGKALAHLYDPDYLRRSVLIELFGLEGREDAADALRRILVDAIARLKPDATVPHNSNAWRFYELLNYRFIEQFTQREVAADLALSVRQLRRQETTAQAVLADYLWAHNDLQKHAGRFGQPAVAAPAADEALQLAGREAELTRLARAIPTEPAALCEIIGKVQETLQPLLRATGVTLRCQVSDDLPMLAVQESAVRQAFVYLTTLAARCVPGGYVRITTAEQPTAPDAPIVIEARRAVIANVRQICENDLSLARRLVEVAGGTLDYRLDGAASAPFIAQLHLPMAGRIPVLAVDDNTDTLALLARYLGGTPYHFVGTADPKTALPLAVETRPAAIILDVMLPGIDGWELLSQLREHPKLARVPFLISTILPYQELANALGAAEFLPKPVSREALLAALDRQVRRRPPGSQ